MANDDRTTRGLRRAFRDGATALDLALIVSVPAVLLLTMILPPSVRTAAAFEYADPSIRTAFASAFVHATSSHLAVNLTGYVLIVPLAYVLSVVSGRRDRFRVAFVALVLACPILLSYLNLTIVRRGVTLGFSGVLLALYGYLPVALGDYLQKRVEIGDTRQTAPLLFFLGMALITVLTLGAVLAHPVAVPVRGMTVPVTSVLAGTLVLLGLALVLVVVLYAFAVRDRTDELRASVRVALQRPGDAEIIVVAIAAFLAVPLLTFPPKPVADGGVLNLYSHLVGYGLGFTATYVTMLLEDRLAGRAARDGVPK